MLCKEENGRIRRFGGRYIIPQNQHHMCAIRQSRSLVSTLALDLIRCGRELGMVFNAKVSLTGMDRGLDGDGNPQR